MKGDNGGLVGKLIEAGDTELLHFQCIIHEAALCGKLDRELDGVMSDVVKLIQISLELYSVS